MYYLVYLSKSIEKFKGPHNEIRGMEVNKESRSFTLEYHFIWIQSYRAEIWGQQGVGAALGILSVDVREVFGRVGGGEVKRARLP